MPKLRRLVRGTLQILFVPLLHLTMTALFVIYEVRPIDAALPRFLIDTIVIGVTPLAYFQGRYPTPSEFISFTAVQYAAVLFTILIAWIFISWLLAFFWKHTKSLLGEITYWQRRILIGFLICVGSLWLFSRHIPSSNVATITVSVQRTLGTMPAHHRGFSQGGESQMREAGYFETAIERLTEVRPRYIRIDHVFDYYNVYSLASDGTPSYNWEELDRVVDAIIAANASPLISLSYLPPALAATTVYARPSDFEAWEELVYETVYHFNVERGLGIRYWEVWNEPNLPQFWRGTIEDYLALYAASARGVKKADPVAQIGGPATLSDARFGGLELFLSERNWITSLVQFIQANNLPMDFVSWHFYNSALSEFTRSVETHRDWVSGIDPQPELLITEWNWTGGHTPGYDNGETLAYIGGVVGALADTSLTQAFYFEPIDGFTNPEGGWGLMRADGGLKPQFYAFSLLNALNGQRLWTQTTHQNVGALANLHSTQFSNDISILLWNYEPDHEAIPINLILQVLLSRNDITLSIFGVDPQTDPSWIIGLSDLYLQTQNLPVESSGTLSLSLEIPRNALRFLQFSDM
jgi:hypothetical protein